MVSKIACKFNEETIISGRRGSGAIYLTGCTQACYFCQNFTYNIVRIGERLTTRRLASRMIDLQQSGTHNIHWVSPTHQLPWLLEALEIARSEGLTLPLVYNTGGYESAKVIAQLDGIVDVYVPDFKFWSPDLARRFLRVSDYPQHARQSLLEMKQQVGDIQLDADGVAVRGLLLRHLVMPGFLDDATQIYSWIARELGVDTMVNIMPQYYPTYRADKHAELARPVNVDEWHRAVALARQAGLKNLYEYSRPTAPTVREMARSTVLRPRGTWELQ